MASLTKAEFGKLTALWDFLAPHKPPKDADAIFVFGGVNLRVPARAAELYSEGYAADVVVSGGAGARTHLHFSDPEADVFARVIKERGVPEEAFVIETAATNTGQNVQFGMAELLSRVPRVRSLLLVATPFIMRRCVATFEKQYPEIRSLPCPPLGTFDQFVDRPYDEFIERLVAEVDRLDSYSVAKFIAPVAVPNEVREACSYFRGKALEVGS